MRPSCCKSWKGRRLRYGNDDRPVRHFVIGNWYLVFSTWYLAEPNLYTAGGGGATSVVDVAGTILETVILFPEDSNAHAPTPDISTGINHHGYCPENSCSCFRWHF